MSEHDLKPQQDVTENTARDETVGSAQHDSGNGARRPMNTFRPEVDITEFDDHLKLVVDLPGADRSTTDLVLEKNVLTITAYPQPLPLQDYECLAREYQVGRFERVFVISDEIDRDGIDAEFHDGVLTVTLPKQAERLARKIAIQNN